MNLICYETETEECGQLERCELLNEEETADHLPKQELNLFKGIYVLRMKKNSTVAVGFAVRS